MTDITSLELINEDNLTRDLATKLSQARCLILNADYQPINYLPLSTLSWRDSIVAVMQNKVDVISVYDDVTIRSATSSFVVPSIVVNKIYRKPRHRIEFSKMNVFLRDNFTCQFCGNKGTRQTLTFDHWVPKAEGGKTTWDNILTTCGRCNNRKGTQNQKRWKPRSVPYRPSYMSLVEQAKKRPIAIPCSEWINYMQWSGIIKVQNWNTSYIVE